MLLQFLKKYSDEANDVMDMEKQITLRDRFLIFLKDFALL